MFSSDTDYWVIGKVTFDTGSMYNWITKNFFLEKRLGASYRTLPGGRSHAFVAFSGHLVVPLGFVNLTWYEADGAGRTTYKTQSFVCEQEERLFDVIFGSRTIFQQKILSWQLSTIWPTQRAQAGLAPLFSEARRREERLQAQTRLERQPLQDRTRQLREKVRQQRADRVFLQKTDPSRATSMRTVLSTPRLPHSGFKELAASSAINRNSYQQAKQRGKLGLAVAQAPLRRLPTPSADHIYPETPRAGRRHNNDRGQMQPETRDDGYDATTPTGAIHGHASSQPTADAGFRSSTSGNSGNGTSYMNAMRDTPATSTSQPADRNGGTSPTIPAAHTDGATASGNGTKSHATDSRTQRRRFWPFGRKKIRVHLTSSSTSPFVVAKG
ncbi:hypothetical protein MBM_01524 [Drepanopeziza brunnea f. sp. 'multigermtubi' MB_m1]|uniref:Uncharacterized protein n=1 Tax=Marssonina brunnea f. sp. multigermtubi (strain MB_m1) TaxID=1072389 RepID=K1X6W5_MARBU|nr:uncharacterized protein MBM_01524 [Drepanopeziza brunnea f. sp. 'multigermtubi' MB_m1]EKD20842.1 hypothetical protein MBM_01524 [Drepanopeziza brunnea f. sp. 'multigermtubi' MB_m1]